MHEFIGFTITGLVTASIYAIVAGGLTLTYATTGIFNWSHGAFAAVGAFAYWQLTTAWGWPKPLAFVVCVGLLGPGIGLVVEAVIMRRLEGTSEITRMAVTLALLIGIVAALSWIWDPGTSRIVTPMLDTHAVHVFGQRIPAYDLLVVGVALLAGAVLWWLLYRHRSGVEMRAVVDDRTLVSLNGVSVVRTAQLSWCIGATTAVLAGVLISPTTTLSAAALALLIMNAFAAAVIGRLRSLGLTVLGALILGLATAYGQGYIGSNPNFPAGQYLIGMITVIPVLVLFIALPFLPQERLRASRTRQARELSIRPTWTGSAALAAVVILGAIAAVPLLAPGDLHTATQVWGIALVALSLVPLLGWAGRLAVCPFAFAVVGAMAYAHLAPGGQLWGIVLGAFAAGFVAAALSLLAVRLSPLYLALATAAFAIALDNWILGLPPFDVVLRIPFTDVTLYRHRLDLFQGGAMSVGRPDLFGLDLAGDRAYFVFGAVIFAAALLALTALRRSDLGLRFLALKDSSIGYATVGGNRRTTTVVAFAISGMIAGVGGALLASAIQRPSPVAFSFFGGLSILVVVVIFGVSSLGSPIAAGMFLGAPLVVNLFPSLAQISPTLTATAGIGLGDNPNGAIPAAFRPGWMPLLRRGLLLVVGVALLGGAYALTVAGVLSNWAFIGVLVAFAIVWPILGRVLDPDPRASSGTSSAPEKRKTARSDGLSDSPERLALALPLTDADLATVDNLLGVPRRGPVVGVGLR